MRSRCFVICLKSEGFRYKNQVRRENNNAYLKHSGFSPETLNASETFPCSQSQFCNDKDDFSDLFECVKINRYYLVKKFMSFS